MICLIAMKKKIKISLIWIILIIATLLRLINLGAESIWIDEATSLYHAQESFMGNIKWVASDTNLPLYNIFLWQWIRLFGISEIAIRSLSVIFGIMSVFMIYLLGKRLFSKKIGILSAIFLSISSAHLYYSQEARSYSLFIFLSLLSTYFFYNYLTEKKGRLFYVITTILMIYTHIFSVFVILIQNLFLIYKQRKRLKQLIEWFILQLIIILSFLPWLPILLFQVSGIQDNFWITKPDIIFVFKTFLEFSGNIISLIISIVLIYFLVIRLTQLDIREKENLVFLLLLIFLPISLIYIYSRIFTPMYVNRYFLFALPAFFILISFMSSLVKHKKLAKFIVIILIISMLFSSVYVLFIKSKPDWRKVNDFFKENLEDNDTIFIQPTYQVEPFTYYFHRDCFINNLYYCKTKPNNYFTIEDESGLINKGLFLKNHVWLLRSYPEYNEPDNSVFLKLNRTKKFIREYNLNQIKIYYFE